MSPEEIRLRCWEAAITMAGPNRHDADCVDKIATRIYDFVATGANPPTPAEGDETSETPDVPARRGPGRPRKS